MYRAVLALLLSGCSMFTMPAMKTIKILHGTPGEIDRVCYGYMYRQAVIEGSPVENVSRDYRACAIISEPYSYCLILLPHRVYVGVQEYNSARQHELAHCQGWRH